MKTVEQQVIAIIARAGMIPPAQIRPAATLSDLGLSSLDHVECVTAIEELFHVELTQDELWHLRTVQDVIDAVKNTRAQR
jgi:acyl carrier protein